MQCETYLGLCASKMAVFHCSLARWRPDASKTAPAFGRQSIAMVWDFAESNPFAGAGGDWLGVVGGSADVLMRLSPIVLAMHVRPMRWRSIIENGGVYRSALFDISVILIFLIFSTYWLKALCEGILFVAVLHYACAQD